MLSNIPKSTILLFASMLAVLGLVIFQVMWMNHSRQQLEKTFDQQVCMAVCSALEIFGATPVCQQKSAHCQSITDIFDASAPKVQCGNLPVELADNPLFLEQLRQSLLFYQIDLDFIVKELPPRPKSFQEQLNAHIVDVPENENNISTASLEVTFPGKPAFLLGKLKWMILATILIIGFTACVLLFANWMLRRQKKLLSTNKDFFNQMAHEFRTPLTNIGLALQILGKKNKTIYENHLVQTIQNENELLKRQVESILQMAQFENGDILLQKQNLNLSCILSKVIASLRLSAESKGAIIDTSGIDATYHLAGDEAHLENALRNIIENAIKYADKIPVISVSSHLADQALTIEIKDNGPGIPGPDKDRIFKQFHRVHQSDHGSIKGFGLGLAYVKKIIELHHGTVWVESREGSGCSFFIQVPGYKVNETKIIHAQEDIAG